jgi:hypothetical protein
MFFITFQVDGAIGRIATNRRARTGALPPSEARVALPCAATFIGQKCPYQRSFRVDEVTISRADFARRMCFKILSTYCNQLEPKARSKDEMFQKVSGGSVYFML